MPATEKTFYDQRKLHVAFAVSSLALLAATVWMIVDDYDDPWRGHQRTFSKVEAAKNRADQQVRKTALAGSPVAYDETVLATQRELAQQTQQLHERSQDLPSLQQEAERLQDQVGLANRSVRTARADRDAARADFDLAVRDGLSQDVLQRRKAVFDEKQQAVVQQELDLERKETARDAAVTKLEAATKERDDVAARLKQLQADVARLDSELQKLEPDNWFVSVKRRMKEWPIIDAFNSHHQVVQDWLPDLHITLGMIETGRFDRCRTCHLGIDRIQTGNLAAFPFGTVDSSDPTDWVAQDKYPQPFATHPRLDVYLSDTSPHPRAEFGCTGCHDGQGSGTSFTNVSHTPDDPYRRFQWAKQHDYVANRFWEYPMLPKRLRESACLKCHHSVVELGVNAKYGATAPKLYEGWQLVRTYGCFGCHEINGFQSGQPIGPDLRLEPSTETANQPVDTAPSVPGTMRKVGGNLKHIAQKTPAAWTVSWIEDPTRFRPAARMPRFFHLMNQQGDVAKRLQPVEMAGVVHYLMDKSQPIELLAPAAGYEPNAERGRKSFGTSGCLACHEHEQFETVGSQFGPALSKLRAKLLPGDAGFSWLYTRIRDPHRYAPRSTMPNPLIEPFVQKGADSEPDQTVDPAADIAAFLLQDDSQEDLQGNSPPAFDEATLDQLVAFHLSKAATQDTVQQTLKARKYAVPAAEVTGDEIELAGEPSETEFSDAQWRSRKLNYVGRRTIARYGCSGCHDIAGFDRPRPIGVALQDWGRKDTAQLATEHITEYLASHGEPDGSGTHARVVAALEKAAAGAFVNKNEEDRELAAAFFYESLLHQERPGFVWQKLREPRSYDYQKTSTKAYDERLRMPQFPFNETQIEAIATFVLGLVAEPPAERYLYRPEGAELAVVEGERLLGKYNCLGCHMIDLPEIRYGADLEELWETELQPGEFEEGKELLLKLKPPRKGETGEVREFDEEGDKVELPVVRFRGLRYARPFPDDDPIDQEFAHDLWETLEADGKQLLPGERMLVPALRLIAPEDAIHGYTVPARGGLFAEWLVDELLETGDSDLNAYLAWQMAPPPLYLEGIKVQTPWLYRYLKDIVRVRHTVALRMPQYNLSDQEARALADFFAARDGAAFPYQRILQRSPDYLTQQANQFLTKYPKKSHDYLSEAWRTLNGDVCIKCHAVGGRTYLGDPIRDIRGPDLENVGDRLRPEWVTLWLYNPRWITPYTSMPAPYPRNQQQFPELFDGDASDQTIAVRDALMSYHRLMGRDGKYEPEPAKPSEGTGE